MCMSFKIPNVITGFDDVSFVNFLKNYFGRLFGSDLLKTLVFPIKTWNMLNNSQTTVQYRMSSNSGIKVITNVCIMLYNDEQNIAYVASPGGGLDFIMLDSQNNFVTIQRTSGGIFDSSSFSSLSVQRGIICITQTT